jgi:cytochrome c biogenesis protein CcmG, thiol:disulfide interchange protein DsbE
MKGWHVALIIIVGFVISLFYQGLWQDPRAIPTVLIGTPAPAFAGPGVETDEVLSLDQYRGKVVVLNFWASWCFECKVEHENLLAIQERYGSHPDFVMLGINYQDTQPNAREYLRTFGSNFRHVRDIKGAISIDYGVYGVPETFVLDRQGIIRFKHVGPIVGAVYQRLTQQVIEPLLQGQVPESL